MFAHVIKWAPIRVAIAVAVAKHWMIHHMDVRTSFFNGLLKEDVNMLQPPSFRKHQFGKLVYHLHRSLYGLKKSPRMWYNRSDMELQKSRNAL